MNIQAIKTDKAPEAFGPFSQAVLSGGFLFTSGAMPLNPLNGDLIEGDIKKQTAQTLDNLKAVLEAGGSAMDKVMLITVYMTDMDEFSEMNEVYASYFSDLYPARAAVGVSSLARNARIEMQAIAIC